MSKNATTATPTARSVANATITLGLLSIPVKLYTSRESADGVSFNMHHDCDAKGRLKQQYACQVCAEIVDREHTVKGHEHAKGQSVIFTKDELDALMSVANNVICVHEFVGADELDPLYIEGTSYIGPDKGSEVPFQLISDALCETGKVAIASYAHAGKERLIAVRRLGDGLAYHELRYAAEVRSNAGVPKTEVVTKGSLLALAKQLIGKMSGTFDPTVYGDTVQGRIRDLIAKKVEGGDIVVQPAPLAAASDLTDALRASIDALPNTPAAAAAPKRSAKARVQSVAAKKASATQRPQRAAARR